MDRTGLARMHWLASSQWHPADAECRGHLSAAEPQRLGVVDRVLRGTACRLCCPFSAARTGRTGRRLIGEFPFGTACSGVQFGPNLVTGEGFLARFPRNLDFLGGQENRCNAAHLS